MRHFGIHGQHGPYVPCSDYDPQPAPTAYERNRARRRKRRNVVIVLNIIFWSSAIASALIQWMPQ